MSLYPHYARVAARNEQSLYEIEKERYDTRIAELRAAAEAKGGILPIPPMGDIEEAIRYSTGNWYAYCAWCEVSAASNGKQGLRSVIAMLRDIPKLVLIEETIKGMNLSDLEGDSFGHYRIERSVRWAGLNDAPVDMNWMMKHATHQLCALSEDGRRVPE